MGARLRTVNPALWAALIVVVLGTSYGTLVKPAIDRHDRAAAAAEATQLLHELPMLKLPAGVRVDPTFTACPYPSGDVWCVTSTSGPEMLRSQLDAAFAGLGISLHDDGPCTPIPQAGVSTIVSRLAHPVGGLVTFCSARAKPHGAKLVVTAEDPGVLPGNPAPLSSATVLIDGGGNAVTPSANVPATEPDLADVMLSDWTRSSRTCAVNGTSLCGYWQPPSGEPMTAVADDLAARFVSDGYAVTIEQCKQTGGTPTMCIVAASRSRAAGSGQEALTAVMSPPTSGSAQLVRITWRRGL